VDDASKPADAFFPAVKATEWKEKGRDARPVDEKHLYPYAFVDYERL
jgi:dihydrofolate reductase